MWSMCSSSFGSNIIIFVLFCYCLDYVTKLTTCSFLNRKSRLCARRRQKKSTNASSRWLFKLLLFNFVLEENSTKSMIYINNSKIHKIFAMIAINSRNDSNLGAFCFWFWFWNFCFAPPSLNVLYDLVCV